MEEKTEDFERGAVEDSLRFQAGWLLLEAFGTLLFQLLRWLDLLPQGAWLTAPLCFAVGVRVLCLALSCRLCRRFVHLLAVICVLVDVGLLTTCHPQVSHSVWWGTPAPKPHVLTPLGKENVTKLLKRCEKVINDRRRAMSDLLDFIELGLPVAGAGAPESSSRSGPPGAGGDAVANATKLIEKVAAGRSQVLEEAGEDASLRITILDIEGRLDQVEKAHKKDTREWHRQESHRRLQDASDTIMVVGGIMLQLWYAIVFVLPFRQGLCTLLCSIVLHFTIVGESMPGAAEGPVWMANLLASCTVFFGGLVTLAAKLRLEKTRRQVCALLEDQRRDIIHQKVKRCEAEFAHARIINDYQVDQNGPDCLESVSMSKPGVPASTPKAGKARVARAPPSLRSAPPASRGFLEAGLDCGTRSRGDCLPPGAAVWVEGRPLPMPVDKVSTGQRVLCYDTLGRSPRYVEVTDQQILTGQVQWVAVELADGTKVLVTENHPMQSQAPPEDHTGLPHMSSAVMAKDLRPGRDCLMVMKLVPESVQAVRRCEEDGEPGIRPQRVSLLVRQPERYEVFVAPPGTAVLSATVAVGSANAGIVPKGAEVPLGPVVRRTFIDVEPVDDSAQGKASWRSRRCSSLPPRPRPGGDSEAASDVPASGSRAARASEAAGRAAAPDGTRMPPRSSSDSDISSSFNNSDNNPDAQIVLSTRDAEPYGVTQLSEILRARRCGLPSVGSSGHANGTCQPCIFNSKHKHEGAVPCWKGLLCDRCHLPHEPPTKKKHKSGGMRRLLKKRAALDETGGEERARLESI